MFKTWLVGSEDCWEKSGEDSWFDVGVFYTSVHPALVEVVRYS